MYKSLHSFIACCLLTVALALSLTLAASIDARAFDATSAAPVNVDENGVGLHGYDPVAYFVLGVPAEGNPAYAASFDGVTYHFANADHMARFEAEPEAYAPQFGGFCQFGVALGTKLDGDPQVWRIAEGALFVYAYPDAKAGFLEDIPGNTVRAEENWPRIMNTAPQDL